MVSAWVPTSVPVLTSLSGGLDCVSGNLLSPHKLLLVRVFYHSHGDDSRAMMFRETCVVSEEGVDGVSTQLLLGMEEK